MRIAHALRPPFRPSLVGVAPVLLALLMVGASAGGFLALAASHQPSPSTLGTTGIARSHLPPVPFLPVHVHPEGVPSPGTVNPTADYSSEPAPMGIGDFGVGQGGQPYTYNTTEFLGNFSWQSLTITESGNPDFSDQLNVVLSFEQGGTSYAYWIQDVAFMDSSTGELEFENNIWNFSTPSNCLSNSAVSGNGTVYPYSGCEGYYAVGATTQPGADEFMPSPGDFSLLVRSYFSPSGVPEVAFEYWDGVTSYEVTYDNVVWPWATDVSLDRGFYVDGNATAPSGNFYDAELSLGGPGGGASTLAESVTDASSRLFYWNGHNLEAPRSVWNFGSDTAESIGDVQSIFSHDPDGIPHTTQLNGTTRNATPARAYDQSRVGILAISAPGVASGVVSVAGVAWAFDSDEASVTLVPGSYPVWVNSSSSHHDLGVCVITAGKTTAITVPSVCLPATSTPVGTPGSVDVGQKVEFETAVTSPGTGGDTFNWSSLSPDLGCTPSTGDSISCTPTVANTYPIVVSITDSSDQTNTSGVLEFEVDSDPTVGAPLASPSTVETGAAVSFTVSPSGGSGDYGYSWVGLPGPCSGAITASVVCHPSTAGSYTVSVSVEDSNGYVVASPSTGYSVTPGPAVSVPASDPDAPVDIGISVNFSAVASGGVGEYTYLWSNLPTGCVSPDLPYAVCLPTGSGTFAVTVTVTDSDGGQATSSPLGFTVNPLIHADLVAAPSTVDLGRTATLSAVNVSGGSGGYTYSWSGLPNGCTAAPSSSLSCTPAATGAFHPNVTARDTEGKTATAVALLTVVSDPTIAGVSASRSSVDVGQAVTFTVEGLSGGVGTFSFVWSGLPGGCASADSSTLSCVPANEGTFPVTVNATDSEQFEATSVLEYTVDSVPNVGAPHASTSSAVVGHSFVLAVTVTGGSGDTSYRWSGLPAGCASANASTLACTPTANGTFVITVTVGDSNGASVTSPALTLTVARSTSSGITLTDIALLGAVAAVSVVAVAVVLASRRKRPPSDSA